jgi:hypothetical protein
VALLRLLDTTLGLGENRKNGRLTSLNPLA